MSIDTRYALLRAVLEEHDFGGWAAEFGVYSGYSMSIIAEHMPVIGFDSFKGLPEDWREGFPKGTFGYADSVPRAWYNGPNRMIVPGWFEDTVPRFPFPSLSLVHIDCDLYSSTVTALAGITDSVDVGTILVFDEYHSYPGSEDHEEKAFLEWQERHRVSTELIADGVGEHAQESAFLIRGFDR